MRFVISVWVLLISTTLFGQLEGDQWVIGYYSNGNPNYSIMFLDFSSGDLRIDWKFDIEFKIDETASNICNNQGVPILITNGRAISDGNGSVVEDTISYDSGSLSYWEYYAPRGFPIADGATILPVP